MISVLKIKYETWWAPSLPANASAIMRIILFSFALFWIPKPNFIENLYTDVYWQPVGFFKIFNGPFLTERGLTYLFYGWRIFGFLALLGLCYRITAPTAVLLVLVCTGYDYNFGHVYHSYHVILLNLLFLSLCPANEGLSLDRFIFKLTPKVSWYHGFCLRLQMVHIVFVLFINGYKKFAAGGIDWALSDNLLFHLMRIPGLRPSTWFLMTNHPDVISFSASVVLFFQLTSPIVLFLPRLGLLYAPIWMSFHFGVTWIIGGHMSFWSQIPCYLAFLVFLFYFLKMNRGETTEIMRP